jgi:hypothetical protein
MRISEIVDVNEEFISLEVMIDNYVYDIHLLYDELCRASNSLTIPANIILNPEQIEDLYEESKAELIIFGKLKTTVLRQKQY